MLPLRAHEVEGACRYFVGTLVAVDTVTFGAVAAAVLCCAQEPPGAMYAAVSSGIDVMGALTSFLQWLPVSTEHIEGVWTCGRRCVADALARVDRRVAGRQEGW